MWNLEGKITTATNYTNSKHTTRQQVTETFPGNRFCRTPRGCWGHVSMEKPHRVVKDLSHWAFVRPTRQPQPLLYTNATVISLEVVWKTSQVLSRRAQTFRSEAISYRSLGLCEREEKKCDVYHDRKSAKRHSQSSATETGSGAASSERLANAASSCARGSVGSCRQRRAESPAELSAMLSRRGGGMFSEATATVRTRVGVFWPSPHLWVARVSNVAAWDAPRTIRSKRRRSLAKRKKSSRLQLGGFHNKSVGTHTFLPRLRFCQTYLAPPFTEIVFEEHSDCAPVTYYHNFLKS